MATKINFKQLGDDIINAIEISAYIEKEDVTTWDTQILVSDDKIFLYNHEEMTQKDVATLLGISQSYISRIEKKVIRRLRSIIKV